MLFLFIYKNIKSLNFEATEAYIKNNIVTFDINSFNLNLNDYHDIPAKEILSPVLPLYLELLFKAGNSENYYHKTNEEMNRYTVGIKQDNGSYYYDSSVELLHFIKDDKILREIDFLNNFKV